MKTGGARARGRATGNGRAGRHGRREGRRVDAAEDDVVRIEGAAAGDLEKPRRQGDAVKGMIRLERPVAVARDGGEPFEVRPARFRRRRAHRRGDAMEQPFGLADRLARDNDFVVAEHDDVDAGRERAADRVGERGAGLDVRLKDPGEAVEPLGEALRASARIANAIVLTQWA